MTESPDETVEPDLDGTVTVPSGSAWAGLIFGLFALALGGLVLQQGWVVKGALDPSGPRFMPVVIGLLWVGLAAGYVAGMALSLIRLRIPDSIEKFENLPQVLMLMLLIVGYAYAVDPLGYLVTTTIFFTAAAAVLGSHQHLRDAVVALVLTVLVYFLFSRLLGIYLPPGVLPL